MRHEPTMQAYPRFHLAIPVTDVSSARQFYGELLGCPEGRSDGRWVDFDFFGHQLVAHVDDAARPATAHNPVDGHDVPVPHFGVVLTLQAFDELATKLRDAHTPFVIAPTTRFAGQPGEQRTMFLRDPSGNALEFKAFADIDGQLFAR